MSPKAPTAPTGAAPGAGEIYVACEHPEANGELVLLLAVRPPIVSVALVSLESGALDDADVLVHRRESGGAGDLVVHSDLVAPLWERQLDHKLGVLDSALTEAIARGRDGGLLLLAKRGLPIASRHDPRWRRKQWLLARLQQLSRDCVRQLLQ